ncbi:MAG: hydroxymethylglutaryl-CoA reductase, degradative [Candidatus Marinimicrobia bacterium]|nr:hydroxymethylglutaryl-CoA reductase, degradative [Candidatus Neomarinimicrobiota bacterium]
MENKKSRFPGFYKLTIQERVEKIKEFASLSDEEVSLLFNNGNLGLEKASRMIENVIGTFSMPFAVAVNFLINGKDYVVPMVIEEPSVVAALSFAAKLVREGGGFTSVYSGSITTGQIQITDLKDPFGAKVEILKHREEIIKTANDKDPLLISLGGGVIDIEVRVLKDSTESLVIVHLYVDTKDAMGANTVNTMCESVAPLLEKITGGKVYLRIISNLSDRRIVRSKCRVPKDVLKFGNFTGEEVIEGIIKAYNFAKLDPYRAATHNKGIMNGIDPVLIATGNDWRAQEAAAHAYASKDGKYKPLTVWEKNADGDLVGTIELPVLVGIVGGATKVHPIAQLSLKIMGIKSVKELAEVIGAVGLGQNLAALRVLSTEGLQRGHMKLHARNIASTAGIPDEYVEQVANLMIKEGIIRVDKAKELYEMLRKKSDKSS